MAARSGPVPKGDRAQLIARVPVAHRDVYAEQASREGLPLSTYLAWRLAEDHGLEPPGYLERDRKPRRLGTEELLLGK